MTDPRYGGEIETSPKGVGRWALGDPLRLPQLGVDVAVAVVVFGASVGNVVTQDPATKISDIPVAGFLLLVIGSVALFWRRSQALAVLGVALAMTAAWTALGYPGNPVCFTSWWRCTPLVGTYRRGESVSPRWLLLSPLSASFRSPMETRSLT
jgi:hypothetical protein